MQEAACAGRDELLGEDDAASLRSRIDLFMTLVELGEASLASGLLIRIVSTQFTTAQDRMDGPDRRGTADRLLRQLGVATPPPGPFGSGIADALAANLTDFGRYKELEWMLQIGKVPSRAEWRTERFEL